MRKTLVVLASVFCSVSNQAQHSEELLAQDSISITSYINQLSNNKTQSQIVEINDAFWIGNIKKYLVSKAIKDSIKTRKLKSIRDLFIENDPATIFTITSKIKEGNSDTIRQLYSRLSNSYSYRKHKGLSTELEQLFFKTLNNPELEYSTASLLSTYQFEGYQKQIAERIVSPEVNDPIRLFYTLRKTDLSGIIDNIANAILNSDKYERNQLFTSVLYQSLEDAFQRCKYVRQDPVVEKKLIDFCFKLLDKFPITKEEITLSGNLYKTVFHKTNDSVGPTGTLHLLMQYSGDQRIIPILNQLKTINIEHNILYDFLSWKYNIDRSETNLNKLLSDPDYLFITSYEIDNQGLLLQNDHLLLTILKKFNTDLHYHHKGKATGNPYRPADVENVGKICKVLYKLERTKFIELLDLTALSASDKQLFLDEYNSASRWATYCYLMIPKISENRFNILGGFQTGFYNCYLNEQQLNDYSSFKNELANAGSPLFHFTYDYVDETSEAAAALEDLSQYTYEKLETPLVFDKISYYSPIGVAGISSYDAFLQGDRYKFHAYLLFNDVIYLLKVNQDTDITDLVFNKLADKMLKKLGSTNSFVRLDIWKNGRPPLLFSFGNPEQIKEIVKKYNFDK